MAGPSIAVRVLGDLTGLAKSFEQAATGARGMASRAQSAFGSMLGTLNRTGALGPFGNMLSGINDAIGEILTNGKKIGPAMIGAGGAITAVGATLSAFGSKEQASHQQLQAAISATGHSYEDYGKQIEGAIKHQENFGNTSKETQDALRNLTVATNDPAKALQYLNTAADVAKFKHIDLAAAATLVGKVYNGNTKLLKEFGIHVTKTGDATKALAKVSKDATTADNKAADAKKKLADLEMIDAGKKKLTTAEAIRLRDAQDKVKATTLLAVDAHRRVALAQDNAKKSGSQQAKVMDELGQKTKGQASAAMDTFAGKLDVLKTKLEDQISMFGQKYGPAIQGIGVAVMALGTIWSTIGPVIASMELASMWPILAVVAAVVALIAIGYVLYRNWSTIWGAVKAVITAVWDWIKKNWPLLLGVLLGPIALAVVLILKYWDQIKAGAGALLNWLRSAWNAIVSFFRSVAGSIGNALSGAWNSVLGAANSVISTVKGVWNGLVSWVAGLGSRIAGAAAGMWDGIAGAFRAALNAVIGLWNRLHFNMGGWTVGVGPLHYTFPQFTFGMPTIPRLQTGGIIAREGLFYLHAGEAVTPAKGGPKIVIENAHFATELDVDLFLRRAAWQLETSRI